MKTYLSPMVNAQSFNLKKNFRRLIIPLLLVILSLDGFSQELIFQNPVLESGTAGADGAVYRFSDVTTDVDALLTISSRSSSLVTLKDIDMTQTGHGKAFQPQVAYDNGRVSGVASWWMEFEISFVKTGTSLPVSVTGFNMTALDIDGNGGTLKENVCLYNMQSYVFEATTSLTVSDVQETVGGLLTTVGKKFEGPSVDYPGIDTSATQLMVTAAYANTNSFRMRTGGSTTGSSRSASRMYSFWFKSFSYQVPVESSLPVKLTAFSARKESASKVALNWTTVEEKNASHFVIERSEDGQTFDDAGVVFTQEGNSSMERNYSFTDNLRTARTGMLWYRLKMVDRDGHAERSAVRTVDMGESGKDVAIQTYPNPVGDELRVSVPESWQDKAITFKLYNANGVMVKEVTQAKAGRTAVLPVADLTPGLYIVCATNGRERAIQRIIKTK